MSDQLEQTTPSFLDSAAEPPSFQIFQTKQAPRPWRQKDVQEEYEADDDDLQDLGYTTSKNQTEDKKTLEKNENGEDSEDDFFLDENEEFEAMGRLSTDQQEKLFGTVNRNSKKGLARDRQKQINEIERRQQVFDTLHATENSSQDYSNSTTQYSEAKNNAEGNGECEEYVPFDLVDQEWMTVHLTHTGIRPYSFEPGIRLCGAFKEKEESDDHAKDLYKLDNRCTPLSVKKHMWFLLCKNEKNLQNPKYQVTKISLILEKYNIQRQQNEQEFMTNVDKKQIGQTKLDKPRTARMYGEKKKQNREKARQKAIRAVALKKQIELKKKLEESGDTETKVQDKVNYPRAMELRKQSYAAVIFLPDTISKNAAEAEPIFCWLGCFETEEACRKYIINGAKDKLPDFHIDCVDMYEWLFPLSADKDKDNIKEQYRNPELNRIMNRRKVEKNRITSFKEWCGRHDMVAPVTEITRDGQVSGVDMHGKSVKKQEPFSEPNPLDGTENNDYDQELDNETDNGDDFFGPPQKASKSLGKTLDIPSSDHFQ